MTDSNKQELKPLWCDDYTWEDFDSDSSKAELLNAVYNMFEDIQCLKEQLCEG